MSEQLSQITPNYERSVADMQREIDARRIVALGNGLLRQVNPITRKSETAKSHYIDGMGIWITQKQAAALGEEILAASTAKAFENLVLETVREQAT